MEEKDKKAAESMLAAEVDDDMTIRLKKPIDFEGERYDRIDLSGLHEIKTADMIAIIWQMSQRVFHWNSLSSFRRMLH